MERQRCWNAGVRWFLLATVAVCVGWLGWLAPAASAGVSVSIYPYTICSEFDQEFTAYVWIDTAGSGFDGYETVIRFDPTVLEFVSVQEESLMTDLCYNTWWWTEAGDSTVFISHVAMCGGDTLTGPGALSSITFRAPSYEALTDITFDYIEFYKAGYTVPDIVSHDGTVVITEHCLGACCFADETCLMTSDEECENLTGDFLGYLQTCDPNPCIPAVCCLTGDCYIAREDECADMGGRWHPEWDVCDPNPCEYQGLEDTGQPSGTLLLDPAPNPFSASTLLRYHLEDPAVLRIEIFDAGGRLVRRLLDLASSEGFGAVEWDGRTQAGRRAEPGTYFCRLSANSTIRAQRLIVLK